MTIVHHDLCFGCGQTNLFGLQIELEPAEAGVVGRFFVKQDHQGPPGSAHGGIVAAALDETMALAVHVEGVMAYTVRLEVEMTAPAPVGTFVGVAGRVDRREGRTIHSSAEATGDGGVRIAAATAEFVPTDPR